MRKFYYGASAGKTRYHMFVCFHGPRVAQGLEDGLFPADDMVFLTQPEPFFAVPEQLLDILTQPGGRVRPRAVHLLEDLLLQLHEQPLGLLIAAPRKEGLEKVAARIRRRPEHRLDRTHEARKLHISPVHFRRESRR